MKKTRIYKYKVLNENEVRADYYDVQIDGNLKLLFTRIHEDKEVTDFIEDTTLQPLGLLLKYGKIGDYVEIYSDKDLIKI